MVCDACFEFDNFDKSDEMLMKETLLVCLAVSKSVVFLRHLKGIVSRVFEVLLLFNWINKTLVTGPDQLYFHFNNVFIFKYFKKYVWAEKIIQTYKSWNGYHPEDFFLPRTATTRASIIIAVEVRSKTGRMMILPGITRSRQNHHLSCGERVLAVRGRKIPRMVTVPRFFTLKDLYRQSIF
jgi:hypothetical protein